MSRYFTNFEDSNIGDTPPAGWTRRGSSGSPTEYFMTVGYGTPIFKRRQATLTNAGADLYSGFSLNAVDADANRANADVVLAVYRPASNALEQTIVHVRAAGTSSVTDGYQFAIDWTNNRVRIYKLVATVRTNPFADLTIAQAAGTWMLYRFRANGTSTTTLTVRTWAEGATEPTVWGLTVTDSSSPITAAGWIGFAGYAPSGTKTGIVNFFSVATNGDSAAAPLLNVAYSAWLDTPAERRFLVEISATGYDLTSADYSSTRTFYIANGGYTSKAWDSPASQHYDGWITKIPTFRREMNLALSGKADVGFGSLVVSNPRQVDGEGGVRDDWVRMRWKREYVREYLGDPSWPKHDFRLQLLGTLSQPAASASGITFGIGDLLDILDLKFQTNRIASGPYENQRKPITKGWVASVLEAVIIDQAALYFQLNDGPLAAIEFVYDDGVSLVRNGIADPADVEVDPANDRFSLTGAPVHGISTGYTVEFVFSVPTPLVAGVPYYVESIPTTSTWKLSATRGGAAIDITAGAGPYDAYIRGWWNDLPSGGFWLANSPSGRVFAGGVKEKNSVAAAADYPAGIIDQIVFDKYGLSRDFQDTTSFDALAASFQPITSMVLYDEDLSGLDVLHRYTSGVNVWYGFTPDGLLQVGRIDLPAATSVMDFEERDVRDLVLEQEYLPVNRPNLVLRYNQKFPMNGAMQAAPTVDANFLTEYDTLIGDAWGAAGIPLDDHPNVSQVIDYPAFESLIVTPAADEKTRLQTFYAKKLGKFSFRTRLRATELKIGSTIQLRHSRLGWKQWTAVDPASSDNLVTIDSTKAVVLGIDTNVSGSDPFQVKLTVFRQIPGYYYPEFNPSQIANLRAWYRFGVGITVVTGVSEWADQSGNGNDLLQVTGTFQPALQGDGSILFDGSNDFLQTSPFTLGQPTTVYLLFRQVTWTNSERVMDGTSSNGGAVLQNGSTPTIGIYAGNTVVNNSNLALNTYGAMAIVFNGTASLSQVNNTTPVTGNAGTNNMNGFTLGASSSGGAQSNIQVKEVAIFAGAHNQAQRDQIIAYMNAL